MRPWNKFRVTKWYLQHSLWGRVGVDKIGWSPSPLSHPPRRGGMLFKKLLQCPAILGENKTDVISLF